MRILDLAQAIKYSSGYSTDETTRSAVLAKNTAQTVRKNRRRMDSWT